MTTKPETAWRTRHSSKSQNTTQGPSEFVTDETCLLQDPSKFVAAATVAPVAAAAAAPVESKKEEKKEDTESEDDDMGFGLFD